SEDERAELTGKILSMMRESSFPNFSDRDYVVLPGDQLTNTEREKLEEKKDFVKGLLPDWVTADETNTRFVANSVDVMAHLLYSVDKNYGPAGTDLSGERFLADPWSEQSHPTFYHNGDGTIT